MFFLLPLILIHLSFLINTRFTLWPEMVVYPYLVNNGFLLYRDIINPYPPLFIWFLSFFSKVTNYNVEAYQILTWTIILAVDLLIFVISKKIFKSLLSSLISTTFFVVTSIPFLTNGLWFDLVQTPFVILSIYFMYIYLEDPSKSSRFLLSVIFFLFAFFIKQQAVWLLPAFSLALIFKIGNKKILAHNLIILLSLLCLFLFTQLFIFWRSGNLLDYLNWVFYFPLKASSFPGYVLLPSARQILTVLAVLLFFLPAALNLKKEGKLFIFCAVPLILFAYPRFDYFHLIPALSILSITAGTNINNVKKANKAIKITFAISAIFLLLFTYRYFQRNWNTEIRFFEKDIYESSTLLKVLTNKNEPIYVQNGPDQLLVLSNRLPTKPWADELPWYLELPTLQEKILNGMINANPKFVVYKPYDQGKKYNLGSYKPELIANYIDLNYKNKTQISDTLWLKEKNEK